MHGTREKYLFMSIVFLAGILILFFFHTRLDSARAEYVSARSRYYTVRRNARTLKEAGSGITNAANRADIPQKDFSSRVTLTLRTANLTSIRPTSISPPPGGRVPGTNLIRKQYRVVLPGLTVNEVARFLQVWNRNEPTWKVAEIRLQADRRSDKYILTTAMERLMSVEQKPRRNIRKRGT